MRLSVDEDELASCVACGLCLPHCPTFRVTGDETRSPRGRIAAMRAVHSGAVAADASFARVMDECVLCRGCEPACPSGVPFGRLMEGARHTLAVADGSRYVPAWKRAAYRILTRHRLLLTLSTAGAVAQRLRLLPRRLGLPRLPLRRPRLRPPTLEGPIGAESAPIGTRESADVWLFTGCVMDAWMRPVHQAAYDVVTRAGGHVRLARPGAGADCCGALHHHAGLVDDARRLAARVMAAMPGDAPVLVDSAGCGAAMKDYGRLVGTAAAGAFSARVHDIHEWLAARVDRLPPGRLAHAVAVQDPCHLRHAQRVHGAVRDVLGRYAELVELDDDGLCCGAGGAYAVEHRELGNAIRQRKVDAIRRAGAPVVASANPGCILHLSAAGLDVRHPIEVVADAIAEGSKHGG